MESFYTPEQDRDGLQRTTVTADLPTVLILGDSISIGYTPVVRRLLEGVANVVRPAANCGDTRAGLQHLEAWLGTTPWQVIHFNWGLHDLCYRHPESIVYGHRDKHRGALSVSLEQYRENLRVLVRRLKRTGAALVWGSTTVVPQGEAGRFAGDELRYNAAAEAIMRSEGVAVDDLHALTCSFAPDLFTVPGDVHFTKEGYERLGIQVADAVHDALTTRNGGLPVQWDLDCLHRPPATFPAPGFEAPGVRALFYEGVPYRGQPTRVFAWLGVPEIGHDATCPGMVLLHGGGGTAFDEWVRIWNARGYAAIAMDLCGCVPERPVLLGGCVRERHAAGGPAGWNASFDQTQEPVEDQWTYHAVAAALAGHSLLAAQPGVDSSGIGVTGISWGGYLTSVVAGVDTRLRGAVPVYGCGFLGYDSVWNDNDFPRMAPERARRWLDLWDPSRYLPCARMPMCWVTGTNDFAYPLSSLRKSYESPQGPRDLCIRIEMPHSHPDGWSPAEIGVFMDGLLRGGLPLPRLRSSGRDGGRVWADCDASTPIVKAELCCTRALGHWTDRKWLSYPARYDAATGRIAAELPPRATAWFLNVFDDRNCVASTPHETVTIPERP